MATTQPPVKTGLHYDLDAQGIVTLTMDFAGPVNTMNDEYASAMASALDRLAKEETLTGVVLTSAKTSFFAGGDIHELLAVHPDAKQDYTQRLERIKSLQRRLETLPVPVVAAINGAALGSGLEIALSCHHRIALDQENLVIGFPEVTLGLMPGAGGVVRSVKLLGLQTALPHLLEGKPLSCSEAQATGFIDQTAGSREALMVKAKAWLLAQADQSAAAQQPWDRSGYLVPGGDAGQQQDFIQDTANRLTKKHRGLLPAPLAILQMAVDALSLDIDAALTQESEQFAELVVRPETKNLIMANFIQRKQVTRGASRPTDFEKTTINKLGVIGAGMMGQGIAFVAAKAGVRVILKDVSLAAADKGKAYSASVCDKLIQRGAITEQAKTELLDCITPTDKGEDLQDCDLIIEAVFENVALKNTITQTNEPYLIKDGIWASNTSSLPITQLAQASQRPEHFIGLHFFSPVDRMPLVEIICGEHTSDATLAKAFDFVQQIKQTPIVVNDAVGFFTSRVFGTPLEEGAQMVTEGIHPERIENLGKALGMPVGPLTSFDEISLRLIVEINETQEVMGLKDPAKDATPEGTALTRQLLKEDNRPGRHYGGGFYDYSDSGKTLWPTLIERYYQTDTDTTVTDTDIKDRLLFRPVIESLKCLEEGVLRSVADGNIGSLLGIGAPKWTGGYIQFVNTYGLQRFINRCDELAERYGERFKAPTITAEYLKANKPFI